MLYKIIAGYYMHKNGKFASNVEDWIFKCKNLVEMAKLTYFKREKSTKASWMIKSFIDIDIDIKN